MYNNPKIDEDTASFQGKTILIFSANYLPYLGGVEKFTYNLSKELERLECHAVIITNNVFNLPEYEILEFGAEIYRIPCYPLLKGRLPIPRKNKDYRRLIKAINKLEVDYVLINTRFYPHSLLGAKISKQKKITPVIIDHGSAYLTLNNPIIDYAIKIYEHLITKRLRRYKGAYYGISKASLKWLNTFNIEGRGIINNSIDADSYLNQASSRNFKKEFNLKKRDFIVCFTGRLIPEKGVPLLIECAEHFLDYNPHIHFILAGDGPLKGQVLNKNLPNVHLTGKINSADIAALLIQSDVFCLPTRSEGFSTSLLEASACYTPAIITNVGGVAELIPSPKYGVVLDSASAKCITSAIKFLYSKEVDIKTLGYNIGTRVREMFSWHDTAKKALTACREANHDTPLPR